MPRSSSEVLEQEFLEIRAKILEVGAFFDRLVASPAGEIDEDKLRRLKTACDILCDDSADKAKQIQLHFSREYQETWREEFGI